MASNINPNTINITYPIAGQDNDTQGFRDNFSSIKNNFSVALTEISALQANSSISLTTTAVPVSHSDAGTPGQIAYDATHLYVCIATNTWVRASLATW
jgi:hypothetical protein